MKMLGLDLTDVVATGAPVPDGTYPVVIEKAEVSPTKTGGEMIKVQFKINQGSLSGRNLFSQFNIKNANPLAVSIGLGELKGMLKAFGHPNPNRLESTSELVGLKGEVTTKIEEQAGYSPTARIRKYQASPQVSGDAVTAQATSLF
jgi:hypothetical protein